MVATVMAEALSLLAEVGFERMTLPEVATRAGVNKTSLYRRWPTKAVLIRDALSGAMAAPPDFVPSGDLTTDLVEWGKAAVLFSASALGQAVFRALLVAHVPELKSLPEELSAASAVPRLLFEAAKARGELDASIDTELVLSMVAGTLLHRQHVERRPVDEQTLGEVIDIVLHGVLGPARRGFSSPLPVAPSRSASRDLPGRSRSAQSDRSAAGAATRSRRGSGPSNADR